MAAVHRRRSPSALLELPGARLDPRALRCATRLQVGLEPAPATLSLVESYGEPRFKLDVNWDPDTVPAFLDAARGRGARPHAARSTRTCWSRSSTSCARTASTSAPNAREVLDRLRARARRGDRRRPPLARARTAPSLDVRGPRSAASCGRSSAPASPTRWSRGALFLADEQGLGKTVQALAALEADDAYPAVVVCPA